MSQELDRLRAAVVHAEGEREQLRAQRALVAELEECATALAFRVEQRREAIRRIGGPGLGAAVRRTFLVSDAGLEDERIALEIDEQDHGRVVAELANEQARMSALAASMPDVKALRSRFEDELRAEVARSDGSDARLRSELWSLDLHQALSAANEVDHAASAALEAIGNVPSSFSRGADTSVQARNRLRRTTMPRLETARLRLRDLARALDVLRTHPPAAKFGEGVVVPVLMHDTSESQRAARESVARTQIDVRVLIRDIERLLQTGDSRPD